METISRRNFIRTTSAATAFLTLGFNAAFSQEKIISSLTGDPNKTDLNQFISIGTDGSIIIFNHRPEMGQGTFQSIPMIVAEELEVGMEQIEIRQSIASKDLYGSQMVVGSRSIQSEFERMRKMGAAAREMLKQAAAAKWKINVNDCVASKGTIQNKSGASFKYSDLVLEASKITPPANPSLKNPAEFTVIGKSFDRQDIPQKVNGKAMFGIDHSVPGMLYASIERSPVFLGKVKSFNKEEVLKVIGVKHVFKTSRDVWGQVREGVAVLADNYWSSVQGRKALKVEWDTLGLEKISDESILKDSYESAKGAGDALFDQGDVASVFHASKNIIEASYETPYQSHVPMEPMNAIVHVRENDAEFWGSTQNPNGVRSFIAQKYNLKEENVKVNYTFMGSGFGRRAMTDVAEEAADLSKQSGKPVKVIWSRDDDQTQGPFRACSVNVLKAAVDKGEVTAFEHKVVTQEIQNQTGPNMKAGRQIMGGITTDYLFPNYRVTGYLKKRHVPISYWRAVYHSTNPFAHECFIDEVAHQLGKDPLEFRLDYLDHPRYQKVLQGVLEKSNWKQKQPGIGRGVAVAERSGAYFAMVIDVTRKNNLVVPIKVTTVLDLGICINPDTVKAQTEGSIVMGLGAAYSGLNLKNGAIVQQNWDTYKMLKYSQCPEIETHIVDSDAPPDGAGEAGLPTVAPALANAIFDLTGKRIRKLPIDMTKI